KAHSVDHGYIVDTSKGKRLVSIWENAQLLRWSNTWREKLYNQGQHQVQRFLLNRNNKKYIHYRGKYFVLSRIPEGKIIEAKSEEECKFAGEVFAQFHSVLDRIEQKVTTANESEFNEDYFTNGSTVIKNVMEVIEQKEAPTLTDKL